MYTHVYKYTYSMHRSMYIVIEMIIIYTLYNFTETSRILNLFRRREIGLVFINSVI